MSEIKFKNGTTIIMENKPMKGLTVWPCARCDQLELEYVDLHAQYNALTNKYRHAAQENVASILRYNQLMAEYVASAKSYEKDYDKAQETIGELQRQVKLFGGSY